MKLAYCPACGAAEKPVLVMTSHYTCPDCETTTPRDRLEFKRRNHYVLAGTGTGSSRLLDPVHLGTTIGAASGAGTSLGFNTPILTATNKDLILVCITANGVVGPASSVSIDGSDAMSLIVETLIAKVYSAVFIYDAVSSGFTIPGSSHVFSISLGRTTATNCNAAAHVITCKKYDPQNQYNAGSENSAQATSTSPSVTSAGSVVRDSYDIAVLASAENTGDIPVVWGNAFGSVLATGSNTGGNDFRGAIATKYQNATGLFTASGTLSNSTQWGMCSVSIKPAP